MPQDVAARTALAVFVRALLAVLARAPGLDGHVVLAASVLGALASPSRPARRRLSDAPALLDRLAQLALGLPDTWGAADDASAPDRLQIRARMLMEATTALLLAALENPVPWATHTRGLLASGSQAPAEALSLNLPRLAHLPEDPDAPAGPDSDPRGLLARAAGVLGRTVLGSRSGFAAMVDKGDLKRMLHGGGVPDGCDRCGAEGGELLRCGGCKLTRYCGVACQRADWAGHKRICWEWF
ncbi:hypothetical protein DFJ74DRAFT_693752 [Hyaloraphidium curvatum]|nr:hypothetical protein DFJ74DRAFT_693752 [Hyaloraphidium curvatum]